MAIIRVRGSVHLRSGIADAMKMLNLNRVNHCVVVDNRPQYMGMINKAKDYITFGEINEETVASLIAKRGRLPGNVRLDDAYVKNATGKDIAGFAGAFMKFEKELKDIPDISPVFRLRPPKKGHARGGIKKPCSVGGALGNRKEKINDLLAKMI
ncbi:MAG: 50S ribosomal protein L30 [Candidatus Altiarchaeales archaeon IMC4]|nr:MAG: 50S ribosomal protein L30 [Candidatus Altiarchaeales archaeon IMC4]